jgi:ribokinase
MTENAPKIVVLGPTLIDMAIKCPQIPPPGNIADGNALSYYLSGPGPIQAVQAALCGCSVSLISKIGADPLSQLVVNTLDEYDLDTQFIFTATAKNTGLCVTLVNAAGENASTLYYGANAALTVDEIDIAADAIAQADICLIHGKLPTDAVVAAIRQANLHKTKTIVNPARPVDRSEFEDTPLPADFYNADILIPNLTEAAELTDNSLQARWDRAKIIGSELVSRGAKSVIITLGKRGSLVVDRQSADHVPAFEIDLVDHTARGDAFAGALAAFCATDNDIRKAVKFANAAAALTCTKFGTLDALPTKADIIQMLQAEDMQ